MTAGLDLKQAAKLARICAMLASPSDGERAVAATKATAFLKAAGLSWEALIRAAAVECSASRGTHASQAKWLLALGKDLRLAQRAFLHVIQWRVKLTPWERGVLDALTDQVEGRVP